MADLIWRIPYFSWYSRLTALMAPKKTHINHLLSFLLSHIHFSFNVHTTFKFWGEDLGRRLGKSGLILEETK